MAVEPARVATDPVGGAPGDRGDLLPPIVAAALARLDFLVQRLEEHPEPAVRDYLLDLLQSIDTVHREGLRSLGELLKVAGLQRRALDDPEVKLLFDLYDLGEGGERQRAEAVLSTVREHPAVRGRNIELLAVSEGVITARVEWCGDALAAGAADAGGVRAIVEGTLREGLPEFQRLELIEGGQAHPPESSFVPLSRFLG